VPGRLHIGRLHDPRIAGKQRLVRTLQRTMRLGVRSSWPARGNTNSRTRTSCKAVTILRAATDRGTRCSRGVFMRAAGTVHTPAARSISSQTVGYRETLRLLSERTLPACRNTVKSSRQTAPGRPRTNRQRGRRNGRASPRRAPQADTHRVALAYIGIDHGHLAARLFGRDLHHVCVRPRQNGHGQHHGRGRGKLGAGGNRRASLVKRFALQCALRGPDPRVIWAS